jgi:hypothetical protein
MSPAPTSHRHPRLSSPLHFRLPHQDLTDERRATELPPIDALPPSTTRTTEVPPPPANQCVLCPIRTPSSSSTDRTAPSSVMPLRRIVDLGSHTTAASTPTPFIDPLAVLNPESRWPQGLVRDAWIPLPPGWAFPWRRPRLGVPWWIGGGSYNGGDGDYGGNGGEWWQWRRVVLGLAACCPVAMAVQGVNPSLVMRMVDLDCNHGLKILSTERTYCNSGLKIL